MTLDIDRLVPERGLIQIGETSRVDFDVDNFTLSRLHGDVLFCEFVDLDAGGDAIKRGNIFIPLNTQPKAWRQAKVILAGIDSQWTAVGDIVMFPNNYGVEVKKLEVHEHGVVEHGVFLNESRIFGSCIPKTDAGK